MSPKTSSTSNPALSLAFTIRTKNLTFGRHRAAPGGHLIDINREICPDNLCRAVIGNALVYRDKSHLTATFARTLAPAIERGLKRVGLS